MRKPMVNKLNLRNRRRFMWTNSPEERSFIIEISQSVVGEIAPEEMDLFDELMQEYFNNPSPPDLSKQAKDDALGFGLGEVLLAFAPAVAAALRAVMDHLLGQAMNDVKEEGATAIRNRIKDLLNPEKISETPDQQKKDKKNDSLDFSRGHLAAVRKIARAEAKKFGLTDEDAEKLAGVLIGKLALA
jgi:hypothetical protein